MGIPSIRLILAAMSLMMSGKSMFGYIGCSARHCGDNRGGFGKIGLLVIVIVLFKLASRL